MDAIFGYSFEEIRRAQQGGRLGRVVDVSKPAALDGDLTKDQALLDEHGIEGLKAKGFFGVLDRIQRAGLQQRR